MRILHRFAKSCINSLAKWINFAFKFSIDISSHRIEGQRNPLYKCTCVYSLFESGSQFLHILFARFLIMSGSNLYVCMYVCERFEWSLFDTLNILTLNISMYTHTRSWQLVLVSLLSLEHRITKTVNHNIYVYDSMYIHMYE